MGTLAPVLQCSPATYTVVCCGLGHSPTTLTHILLFLLIVSINSYTFVNLSTKELQLFINNSNFNLYLRHRLVLRHTA
jgi:hypothetical protein